MTIFRPLIGNSPLPRRPRTPHAAIPPAPAAAQPPNATADIDPGPNPRAGRALTCHPSAPHQPSPTLPPIATLTSSAWQTSNHAPSIGCARQAGLWILGHALRGSRLRKTWVAPAIAAAPPSRGRVPPPPTTPSNPARPSSTPPPPMELPSSSAPALPRPTVIPPRHILLRGVLTASAQPASLSLRDTPMLEDTLERTSRPACSSSTPCTATCGQLRSPPCQRFRPCLRQPDPSGGKASLLYPSLHPPSPQARPRDLPAIELSAAVRTEFIAGSSPDALHPACAGAGEIQRRLPRGFAGLPHRQHWRLPLWISPSALTPEEVMMDQPIDAGLPKRKQQQAEWLRQYLLEGELTIAIQHRICHFNRTVSA